MPDAPRPRLQMSLGRFLLVSNVYAAVACLCVMPMSTLWELGVQGGWSLALPAAVAVPLAWSLTSWVMIRDRPARGAAISALVLCSLSAALGYATWSCIPLLEKVRRGGPGLLGPIDLPGIAVALIVVPLLLAAILALARRLAGRFAQASIR